MNSEAEIAVSIIIIQEKERKINQWCRRWIKDCTVYIHVVSLTTCLLLGHLLDGLMEARQCLVYGSNETQTQAPIYIYNVIKTSCDMVCMQCGR